MSQARGKGQGGVGEMGRVTDTLGEIALPLPASTT